MEYMPDVVENAESGHATIACCQCSQPIEPNAANMCVACLREHVDITEGIPKQSTLYFCRNCERYLQPPAGWVKACLESRELLSLCLKKIKGMNKIRLIDAGFVWTEPHSKRLKVKLTVQQEVMNGAVLQQTFVVEFTICNQMCDECHRVEAKDFWRACVQIRQKTSHKKTLFYLEQLILKHRTHIAATSIKQVHEGLDFYYQHQQESRKMVEFLQAVVPCKASVAKELISHDPKSNVYNYKYTALVEIVPICKDNVICLPAKLAQQLGNLSQICLVLRVTQNIQLMDPNTCCIAELRADVFWRFPFRALCHPRQLTEYIVMQVEVISEEARQHLPGQSSESVKHQLADAWVIRSSDFGHTDVQIHCRTHLGHLLSPGDSVLGFDIRSANVNDSNFEKLNPDRVPDVVLVKKMYADGGRRARKRQWKLRRLEGDAGTDDGGESVARDYNDFLEDLEEDPAYRQNVNIYKGSEMPVETDEEGDEEFPKISLAEMLDDLHISVDATGDEGAAMLD